MILLQSQLSAGAEKLFSLAFFVLLLGGLYVAFKIFNRNHK